MQPARTHRLIAELLGEVDPPELGPGPRPGVWSQARVETALGEHLDPLSLAAETRRAIKALVLLWHDHLDAAHRIAQALETRDGALVHAIVHRREPDFWNSKYWWRRAGEHPCFPELARRVREFLEGEGDAALAKQLLPDGRWDAFAFVDACAAAAARPANDPSLRRLRRILRIETETALEQWLGGVVPR